MLFLSSLLKDLRSQLFPPVCVHCQTEGYWLCPDARDSLGADPLLTVVVTGCDHCFAAGDYDHPVRSAYIQAIKYRFWTDAAEALPELLSPVLTRLRCLPRSTAIIPVPLHSRRLRERGFNQSRLIAEVLAERLDRPVYELLYRKRHTAPQATLSESARVQNVRQAFAQLRSLERIPSCGILVDDVVTTGSTLSECAAVLRQAGVKKIIGIALAKG